MQFPSKPVRLRSAGKANSCWLWVAIRAAQATVSDPMLAKNVAPIAHDLLPLLWVVCCVASKAQPLSRKSQIQPGGSCMRFGSWSSLVLDLPFLLVFVGWEGWGFVAEFLWTKRNAGMHRVTRTTGRQQVVHPRQQAGEKWACRG